MIASNLARFDHAAETYDRAASVQAQIAAQLVHKAIDCVVDPPAAILDIGCGTGFVAEAAAHRWPQASVTAIDGAPSMLKVAQRKVPHLRVIESDIAARLFEPAFDLVFSSMVLHWLSQPRVALENWRRALKPGGQLFAALLAEGSFQEWRDLCTAEGLADGIWPFPRADFAGKLSTEREALRIDYPSAKDFLRRLKATGASMPKPYHRPFDSAMMRRLLAKAPKPFAVTYRVLYIKAPSPVSI